jgi:hypothetical protein
MSEEQTFLAKNLIAEVEVTRPRTVGIGKVLTSSVLEFAFYAKGEVKVLP